MTAASPSTRDWTGMGKIVGLVVLTCLCYWPSLGGGFLWDDDVLISHDPLIQSFGGLRRIWFSTEPYDYFPLTYTSFWLEWPLWGTDPLGYRVVNLLLHLASAFLLWRLLTRLRVPGAWLGALLFAVHPVNVASVAWIAERKNTLSMAFYLASALCWVESEDRGRARWYALSVGFFALAALSKSSVVMWPCALLLLIWWRQGNIRWADLVRSAPFFGVSLVTGLLTVWFQFHRSLAHADLQRIALPLSQRVLIAGRAMGFYLGKTVAPLHLSMIYPRWETVAWIPFVAVTAILLTAWLGRARWGRGSFTALGYFVLMALPVSGLVPMTFAIYSFVSDHFVYIPMLGLLAGLAASLTIWREHGGIVNRWLAAGVTVLLVGWFVVASRQRAGEFGSSRRLWETTLALNPRCAIAHNNLGLAIEDATHLSEAETHFRAALDLDPELSAAMSNLAGVLQREGRWRESASAYASVLSRVPEPKDFNNYGVVLLQLGETERARVQFRSAARMEPAMLSPRFNLFKIAYAQRDHAAAADELHACLQIDPDDVPSLLALATMEIKGETSPVTDAAPLAERACALTGGGDAVTLATLSRAYLATGRREAAIGAAERAQAAAERGQQPEATAEIGHYLEMLRAKP